MSTSRVLRLLLVLMPLLMPALAFAQGEGVSLLDAGGGLGVPALSVKTNPDGTQVGHFWGNGSSYPDLMWEARPIPGTSNFTRNSEVENCETSAWGRALAALGFGGKSIASVEEINVKKQLPAPLTAGDVAALAKQKKMPVDVLKGRVAELLGKSVEDASMLDLSSDQLQVLKTELEAE